MKLHDRIAVLEAAQAASDLQDPGPDASDFERRVYQIQRCALTDGRAMTRERAEALSRRFDDALAAIDAIDHGRRSPPPC